MKSVRNLQGNTLKLSFTKTKAHGQTLDPLESTLVSVLLSVNQDALAFSRNIEHLIKSNSNGRANNKDKKEAIDSKALQNAIRWRLLASLAAYAAALAKQLVSQRNVLRRALKNELPNYALFVSF